jgi:hypothetical protein
MRYLRRQRQEQNARRPICGVLRQKRISSMKTDADFGQLGFTTTWLPLKEYTGWTSKTVIQSPLEFFDMWKLPPSAF